MALNAWSLVHYQWRFPYYTRGPVHIQYTTTNTKIQPSPTIVYQFRYKIYEFYQIKGDECVKRPADHVEFHSDEVLVSPPLETHVAQTLHPVVLVIPEPAGKMIWWTLTWLPLYFRIKPYVHIYSFTLTIAQQPTKHWLIKYPILIPESFIRKLKIFFWICHKDNFSIMHEPCSVKGLVTVQGTVGNE